MLVAIALPTDQVHSRDQFVTSTAVQEMARHVEDVGLDAVFVTDHPAPDDRWLNAGGHHALEPTVALSFAAAATTRLTLLTNVYVAAYRAPLLAAKSLASLDALSQGRLIVGVAAGYLKAEFAALGVEFETRGARLDEAIDTMREAWTGEVVQRDAVQWSARSARILPTPQRGAALPIWGGGNSLAAMRRVAQRCDGWLPFATPPGLSSAVRTAEISSVSHLAQRLEILDELCADAGRARPTICFTPISTPAAPERLGEEIAQLAALGVDWVSLTVPATVQTRRAWMDEVEAIANLVHPNNA